jgi:hypothetical protein
MVAEMGVLVVLFCVFSLSLDPLSSAAAAAAGGSAAPSLVFCESLPLLRSGEVILDTEGVIIHNNALG